MRCRVIPASISSIILGNRAPFGTFEGCHAKEDERF